MNANDMYFEDFRFGDKKLSDFGGIIYNEDGWIISNGLTSSKTTTKLSSRDGELYLGSTYNPRTITVPIFLQEDIDIDEFYAWLLNGEQELEFEDSDRKINAVLDNQLDIRSYYDGDYKGLSSLNFIAYDPYWRAVKDTYTIVDSLGSVINIKTKSNVTTYPIIKLTPTAVGKVSFQINDTIVTLDIASSNLNREITIDCEREEIYDIRFEAEYNLFNIYSSNDYYEFPRLNPFVNNTFVLRSGSVNGMIIYHNNMWI